MSSALFDDLGDDHVGAGTSALFDGSALFDEPPAVVAPRRQVVAGRDAPPAGDPSGPGQPREREPQPEPQQRRPGPPRPQQPGRPAAAAPRSATPGFAPQAVSDPAAPPVVDPAFAPQGLPGRAAPPPAAVARVQPSATVRSGSGRDGRRDAPAGMIEAAREAGGSGRPTVSVNTIVGALVGTLVLTGLSAASIVIGVILLVVGLAAAKNVVQSPAGRRTTGGVVSAAVITLSALLGLILHFVANAH